MIRRLMHVNAPSALPLHDDDGLIGGAHENCNGGCKKREGPPRLILISFFCFICFLTIWFYRSFPFSSNSMESSCELYRTGKAGSGQPSSSNPNVTMIEDEMKDDHIPTSTNSTEIPIGTMYCDRSQFATDICFMKGDIRTHSSTKSIHLYPSKNLPSANQQNTVVEKIKPYTRKWETTTVMTTVQTLSLIQHWRKPKPDKHHCDVYHDAPAIVFSTSGYTGNQFHAFNDGLIPLFITTQHLNRKVVFVIMKYHDWWYLKYIEIVSQLTDYQPIDFDSDKRTHCFPEVIAGLKIHDQLTVDPLLMTDHKSIRDFRDLLDRAFQSSLNTLTTQEQVASISTPDEHTTSQQQKKKPTLALLSRTGRSRSITNEDAMVSLAEDIGFNVRVVRPVGSSKLSTIYKTLNESQVLVGVLGAAMTHLLFMRPGCMMIQIVPIGTEKPAQKDFGEPAMKLGLKYVKYSIQPRESSLLDQFKEDDPVITDPDSIGAKGWDFTKKYYLDNQRITLDLERFRTVLVDAYNYSS